MFIRTFFNYMWSFDTLRPPLEKKLLYIVLEGEHNETAVLEVDDSGCPGLSSAVPSVSDGAMAFVHHTDATEFLRGQMTTFFMTNTALNDSAAFLAEMKTVGTQQLTATLTRLASGLPLYKVCETLCCG